MSLLDTASLIVTPNGYKDGKLYSVIPSDGSGDLSVTRATTATRVNSAGLVELVPYNLLSWSEDFSSTRGFFANVVGSSTAVFTANYATAPNGTTTADRIQLALNGQPYADWVQPQSLPLVTGNTYTYSIYLKSLSGSATLMIFNDGVGNITKTITTEWQRYDYTWTATTGSVFPRFLLQAGTSLSADLVAWGYQINEGTMKPYQKTETRLNIPRLDYSNGTCPSILVEPQRTNLLTYSSSFDNSGSWGTVDSAITANTTISPSGVQDADTMTLTTPVSRIYQLTALGANTYTCSVWVKAISGTPELRFLIGKDGTEVTQNMSVTTDWQRFKFTFTASSSVDYVVFINNNSSLGSVAIWGAQLEAGNYASSYIPTLGASVTRNADVISKTGISSLIGQTEGSVFLDLYFELKQQSNFLIQLTDGTNDFIELYIAGGIMYFSGYNGASQWTISTSLTDARHKIAYAYKANDIALYVDGVLIGTDTSAAIPTCNNLYLNQDLFGQYNQQQYYNAAALWKTRLTNAQLATLTTI